MIYTFCCKNKNHPEPVIIEHECRITEPTPEALSCPECQGKAKRLWHGQKFYAKVPGAHGGGPATR